MSPLHCIENICCYIHSVLICRLVEVAMKLILDFSPCSLSSMSPFLPLNPSTTFTPPSYKDTYNHSLKVVIDI